MLFAFLGLVWSRTDLLGHNDVIFGPHTHAPPTQITGSAYTGIGRSQNSDSACLLASGIIRHHYLVVWVVLRWLGSPLLSKILKNKVQGDGDGEGFGGSCGVVTWGCGGFEIQKLVSGGP